MKSIRKTFFALVVLAMLISICSCSAMGGDLMDGAPSGGSYGDSYLGDMGPSGDRGEGVPGEPEVDSDDSIEDSDSDSSSDKNENVTLPSGMMTAGAWNDNDNYEAWLDLFEQGNEEKGKFFDYTNPDYSWGYNSQKRVKVTVSCGENAIAGAQVVAYDEGGNKLYAAVSDANGNAYLFPSNDSGKIVVTSGEGRAEASFDKENRELNVSLDKSGEKRDVIEIMLVVDVTGSMGDEIHFLKAELADVINRIAENNSGATIKLALLFYRDTDDMIPFAYFDFMDVTNKAGLTAQQTALNLQSASGGGDYPEAVDEALDIAVNKQWSTGATTKIIFHVLDAPAHNGSEYKSKLVNATKTAAEKGLRICPIICSGAAESTEYTMREAAIYTGGTFVFVTDDSGIGNSHHDPELPNVTVELLNSLMVRLVNGYHTGNFEAPIYWKQDQNLNNK